MTLLKDDDNDDSEDVNSFMVLDDSLELELELEAKDNDEWELFVWLELELGDELNDESLDKEDGEE